MSSSMIATIYLIALVVFFILLVVLTIAWIAGKAGSSDDMYYDDEYDDYDEYEESEEAEYEAEEEADVEDIGEETEPEAEVKTEAEASEDIEEEAAEEETEEVEVEEEISPEQMSELTDASEDVEEEAEESETAEPEDETEEDVEEKVEVEEEIPIADEFIDSAFAPQPVEMGLTNEEINQSVREAVALGEAVAGMGTGFSEAAMFGISEELEKGNRRHHKASVVPSTDDFFWFNKMDVAERPSYKTPEMYYHYFDTAKDCIEDLLVEMYDCALVRTEEIRYIAYGIEPKAISMREILATGNYVNHQKLKEPTTQDLVRIYEKWCGYVEKLFDKVEIHADEYTLNEIKRMLCEYGRNEVDVLLEGK